MALTPERIKEIQEKTGIAPGQGVAQRSEQQKQERINRARELAQQGQFARSAEQSMALFPAEPGEGPVQAGLKATGNVPSSMLSLGKDIVTAVASPIDTAKGLFSTVRGGGSAFARKMTSLFAPEVAERTPKSEEEQTFDALVNVFKERYGSLEAAQRTATNDPVGFGADVVAVLQGGATTLRKAGVSRLGNADVVSEISGGLKNIVNKGQAILDTKLKVADKIDDVALSQMEKALNLNPSDIRRIEQPNVAGTSPQQWMLERGVKGSQKVMADQLATYRTGTKNLVDEGLAQIDETFTGNTVKPARDILSILEDTFSGIPGNEDIIARIDELKNAEALTLTDLQSIQRLADANIRLFKSTGEIKSGAQARGLGNLRDKLKTTIENEAAQRGFENVRDLKKETQVAYEIENALRNRLNVKGTNLELGIRDFMVGVGGFMAGDFGTGIGAIAVKKILESSRFRTELATRLARMSEKDASALQRAVETGDVATVSQFVVPILNALTDNSEQGNTQ